VSRVLVVRDTCGHVSQINELAPQFGVGTLGRLRHGQQSIVIESHAHLRNQAIKALVMMRPLVRSGEALRSTDSTR
jgi:hypothetical protein